MQTHPSRGAATMACLLVAGLTCAAAGDKGWPASAEARAQLIGEVKTASAASVETGLPAITVEHWLKDALGVGARLDWRLGGCDLAYDPEAMSDGVPRCVEVHASRPDHLDLRLHLLVGTDKKRAAGPPSVYRTSFVGYCVESFRDCQPLGGAGRGYRCIRDVERLSDIPKGFAWLTAQKCQ